MGVLCTAFFLDFSIIFSNNFHANYHLISEHFTICVDVINVKFCLSPVHFL